MISANAASRFITEFFKRSLSAILIVNMAAPQIARAKDSEEVKIISKGNYSSDSYSSTYAEIHSKRREMLPVAQRVVELSVIKLLKDPNSRENLRQQYAELDRAYSRDKQGRLTGVDPNYRLDEKRVLREAFAGLDHEYSKTRNADLESVSSSSDGVKGILLLANTALLHVTGSNPYVVGGTLVFGALGIKADNLPSEVNGSKDLSSIINNNAELKQLYEKGGDSYKSFLKKIGVATENEIIADENYKNLVTQVHSERNDNIALPFDATPEDRSRLIAADESDVRRLEQNDENLLGEIEYQNDQTRKTIKSEHEKTKASNHSEALATREAVNKINEFLEEAENQKKQREEVAKYQAVREAMRQSRYMIAGEVSNILSQIDSKDAHKGAILINGGMKVAQSFEMMVDPLRILGAENSISGEKEFQVKLASTIKDIVGKVDGDLISKNSEMLKLLGAAAGAFMMAGAVLGVVNGLMAMGKPSANEIILQALSTISKQLNAIQDSINSMNENMVKGFKTVLNRLGNMEKNINNKMNEIEERLATQIVENRGISKNDQNTDKVRGDWINKVSEFVNLPNENFSKHLVNVGMPSNDPKGYFSSMNELNKASSELNKKMNIPRTNKDYPDYPMDWALSISKLLYEQKNKSNDLLSENNGTLDNLDNTLGFHRPNMNFLRELYSTHGENDSTPYINDRLNLNGNRGLLWQNDTPNFSFDLTSAKGLGSDKEPLGGDSALAAGVLIDQTFDQLLIDNINDEEGFKKFAAEALGKNPDELTLKKFRELYANAQQYRKNRSGVSNNQIIPPPPSFIPMQLREIIASLRNYHSPEKPELAMGFRHKITPTKNEMSGKEEFIMQTDSGDVRIALQQGASCKDVPKEITALHLLPKGELENLSSVLDNNKKLFEMSYPDSRATFEKALSVYDQKLKDVMNKQKELHDVMETAAGLVIDDQLAVGANVAKPFDLFSGEPLAIWDANVGDAADNPTLIRQNSKQDYHPDFNNGADVAEKNLPKNYRNDQHQSYYVGIDQTGKFKGAQPNDEWFMREVPKSVRQLSGIKAFDMNEYLTMFSGWYVMPAVKGTPRMFRPMYGLNYNLDLSRSDTSAKVKNPLFAYMSQHVNKDLDNGFGYLKQMTGNKSFGNKAQSIVQAQVVETPENQANATGHQFIGEKNGEIRTELNAMPNQDAIVAHYRDRMKKGSVDMLSNPYTSVGKGESSSAVEQLQRAMISSTEEWMAQTVSNVIQGQIENSLFGQNVKDKHPLDSKYKIAQIELYKAITEMEAARKVMIGFGEKNFAGKESANTALRIKLHNLPGVDDYFEKSNIHKNVVTKKHALMEKYPGKSFADIRKSESELALRKSVELIIALSQRKDNKKRELASSDFKSLANDLKVSLDAGDMTAVREKLEQRAKELAPEDNGKDAKVEIKKGNYSDEEAQLLMASVWSVYQKDSELNQIEEILPNSSAGLYKAGTLSWFDSARKSDVLGFEEWLNSDSAQSIKHEPYYMDAKYGLTKDVEELKKVKNSIAGCYFEVLDPDVVKNTQEHGTLAEQQKAMAKQQKDMFEMMKQMSELSKRNEKLLEEIKGKQNQDNSLNEKNELRGQNEN